MADDVTVVVPEPTPIVETTPQPDRIEMWHAEHEARHAEHMAHLESIREEHRSEVNRLEQRISDLEGRIVLVESAPSGESTSLNDALDTVATVGETIADINAAMQEPVIEEPPSPPHSSNDGSAGPSGEVAPDITTGNASPANAEQPKRRGRGIW